MGSANHLVRSTTDQSKCIDIPGGDVGSSNLWIWDCNGDASNQKWDYDSSAGRIYHFKNSNGYCLKPTAMTEGSSIEIAPCDGMSDQDWDLRKRERGSFHALYLS